LISLLLEYCIAMSSEPSTSGNGEDAIVDGLLPGVLEKAGGDPGAEAEAGAEAGAELRCGISIVLLGGGRSLCVDLTGSIAALHDSGITCDHSTIHATVLWRDRVFSNAELRALVRFRKCWLQARGRPVRASDGGQCTFDASQRWGRGSNYIRGELEEFILEARASLASQFDCDPTCGGRPPHVSLRLH